MDREDTNPCLMRMLGIRVSVLENAMEDKMTNFAQSGLPDSDQNGGLAIPSEHFVIA
jgi:hypothetical protein